MIFGRFGDNGELWFEIELIAITGEQFTTEVLFDTGFTTGWLAINSQDLDALKWPIIFERIKMRTARGDELFNIYEGRIIIDGEEVEVPVHVGEEVPEFLMGTQWLETMELVVNKPQGILTLSKVDSSSS